MIVLGSHSLVFRVISFKSLAGYDSELLHEPRRLKRKTFQISNDISINVGYTLFYLLELDKRSELIFWPLL